MKNLKHFKTVILSIFCAVMLTGSSLFYDMATAEPIATPAAESAVQSQNIVKPLNIVNSPKEYLNKKVTINAKFDKFSTLGLDYKPAFKSSDSYISFLIKRDDTTYDIPLSEMKLFLKRDYAEKFIDLKTNDEITIIGTVFSDALGDAWIDVDSISIIKKAPDKDGVK